MRRHLLRRLCLLCLPLAALSSSCGGDEPSKTEDAQTGVVSGDVAGDAATIGDAGDAGATAADTTGSDAGADAATDVGADIAPRCTSHDACPDPGEPCRKGVCDAALGCLVMALPDEAICEDGSACTLADRCKSGICTPGKVKVCDDGDPCTADACDAATGDCKAPAAKDGTACEDGLACTTGDTCAAGKCVAGKAVCACVSDADCKDDGNLCNGVPYCDTQAASPTCKLNPASVVSCTSTKDPCQPNLCDPKTGQCALVSAPKGTPCDDGEKCTANDTCDQGTCKGGVKTCCTSDADCKALEDGDLCNGTLFCDKSSGACTLNKATKVFCNTAWDTACQATVCDKPTGKCLKQNAKTGKPCDADGSPCTVTDFCDNGACLAGASVCACNEDADCAAKDGNNPCTGKHFCDKSQGSPRCVINPATVPQCPTGADTACLRNQCDPQTGGCALVPLPDSVTCDADGTACTPKDTCFGGQCKPDDTVVCPCQQDSDCAAEEDGDLCNGTLFCDLHTNTCKVNPKTVVSCRTVEDTACRVNRCQPKTGQCQMVAVHQGKRCDADGNPCTPNDTCDKGDCVADKNVCPCQSDGACAPWQDDDKCNGVLYCDKSDFHCRPLAKSVVSCSGWQDSECARNRCDPKTGKCGMVPVRQLGSCDADGNPCTLYDTCDKGTCVAGANVCGCGLDAHCGPMQDDNTCNGTLFCDKGLKPFGCAPIPSTVVTCKDAPGCIVPVCDPKTGQCGPGHAPKGKPCDDKDLCSVGDACDKGTCAGKSVTCTDGGICVTNTCDPKSGLCTPKPKLCDDGNICTKDPPCSLPGGCSPTALPDGTTCTDDDPCTLATACQGGKCLPKGGPCDDQDPCTADACSGTGAKATCVHSGISGGLCDDGFPCTSADTCTKGVCGGVVKSCDDGNACTADTCDAATGKCVATATVAPCSDGSACTKEDACSLGSCKGVAISCDDGKPCTADSCDPKSGCSHKTAPDGLPCAFGPCWFQGQCKAGACSADTERLWLSKQGSSPVNVLAAVAPGGDGTVVAAGYRGALKHKLDKGWVTRIDAKGKALWSLQVHTGSESRYDGLAQVKDGGFVAAGSYDQSALSRPLLVKLDTAGKQVWLRTWPEQTRAWWSRARATSAGGVVVVGGRSTLTGVLTTRWARVDAKGKDVWTVDAVEDISSLPRDLIIDDEDRSTALLNHDDSWFTLDRRDAAGKRLWQRRYDEIGKAEPRALAAMTDGDLLMAGASSSAKGSLLIRTDATGRLRWWRVLPVGGSTKVFGEVWAVMAAPKGQARVFFSSGISKSGTWTQWVDPAGTLVHEAQIDPKPLRLRSAVALPGGGVAMAGFRPEYPGKGAAEAVVARSDGWGHVSCKASGACYALSDCQDGKGCTSDTCAADKGCVNADLLKGEPCEDGTPCTGTGGCAADGCVGGKPRLGTSSVGTGDVAWSAVVAGQRGDLWLGGRRKVSGAWQATVERRGADGAVGKAWTATAGGATLVRDLLIDGNFNPYAVGASAKGAWFASLLSSTFKPRFELHPTAAKSASLSGVALRSRGGRVLAAGHATEAGGLSKGFLVMATTKGKQLWQQQVGPSLLITRLTHVEADAEAWLAVGWQQKAKSSGSYRLYATRVDDDGKALWGKQLDLAGGPSVNWVGGAAPAWDAVGGVVVGGGRNFSVGKAWAARISSSGALLWSHTFSWDKTFANRVAGLVWRPDGVVVMAAETGYGNLRRRVITLDATTGAQRSARLLPDAPGKEFTTDAALAPQDDLILVGHHEPGGGVVKGVVTRVGPWGHETCTAAGVCADEPTCDDGKTCSADTCDPAKGCQHTPCSAD